ncbi:MAG: hypothetical protein JXR96_07395 [Deltaproteobacteria bacterium]|nr:hypothetical protein [Deltaproteobacteria bacterium]
MSRRRIRHLVAQLGVAAPKSMLDVENHASARLRRSSLICTTIWRPGADTGRRRARPAALLHGALIALAVCGLSTAAFAQDPDTIKNAAGAPADEKLGSLMGDASFGQIDGDWYTTVNLGLDFDFGMIGFGVQVPLRLKIYDADPQNDEYGGVLRKEDWDEWTDYLKILRYFRYGHKGELVFLQVGDLPGATLGHGTIVNRYYNNTDLDHYKMGIQLDVNTKYGGVETLANNGFIANLLGFRGYVRPWSFIDAESYANNLAVGFSVVSDYDAPYCLADASGSCRSDFGDDASFDGDGNLNVAEHKAATIIGGDIEFKVLDLSWITLTPYTDLNGIVDAGIGYHLGIMSIFHIPVINLDLQTRVEYRYFQSDYIPAYFDSYYEIQKFGYPFKDERGAFGPPGQEVSNRPKRRAIEELGWQDKMLNGYYAELAFNVMGWFILGAAYDDYDGPYNSNLRMYLTVPALQIVQFGAYYYRHNFEGASDAFEFDDKSLFLVEARYQITSFLYAIGQYWRIWRLDTDVASSSYGEYVPVDDWSLGVGVMYTF